MPSNINLFLKEAFQVFLRHICIALQRYKFRLTCHRKQAFTYSSCPECMYKAFYLSLVDYSSVLSDSTLAEESGRLKKRRLSLLEMLLPYESSCPSVGWLDGRLVGLPKFSWSYKSTLLHRKLT